MRKNKINKLLVILLVLLLTIPPFSVTQAQSNPDISIPDEEISVESLPLVVRLPVLISNITNVTGVDLSISFNPAILQLNEIVENESYFTNLSIFAQDINNSEGTAKVALVANDSMTTGEEARPFLDLNFTATSSGSSPVEISFAEISLEDFNVTDVIRENGSITVNLLDETPPVLSFVDDTPANHSSLNETSFWVNVTSNEPLQVAYLHAQIWNGTVWGFWEDHENLGELILPLMSDNGIFWYNATPPTPVDLILRFWVNGSDLSGNDNSTEVRYLNISGNPPLIEYVAPPPSQVLQNSNMNVSVMLYDATPSHYKIFRNEILVGEGLYQQFEILNISIDTSQIGTFEYTIWANDTFGNENETSFTVEVISGEIPGASYFQIYGNAIELWNASYVNLSTFNPIITDVDGDSIDDIILFTFNMTEWAMGYDKMVAFRGTDGTKLWEFDFSDIIWAHETVLSVDLNGDGIKDIVIPDEYHQCIMAIYGNNGTLFWNYTNSGWDWGPYGVFSADLDGDGIKDIIGGGSNFSVEGILIAAVKSDGTELWASSFEGWVYLAPTSWNYDLNGDNKEDLLLFDDYGNLLALRGYDGDDLWSVTKEEGILMPYSPYDDINSDGIEEVLVHYGSLTLVLSGSDGSELLNISQELISPCIDWNGDNTGEFFTYDGNTVYMRNADSYGSVAWNYELGNYQKVVVLKGSLVIFGKTEAYDYGMGAYTGAFKATKLDENGNEIWNLTRSYVSSVEGSLRPVGDLNGDGIGDLAFLSNFTIAIDGENGNVLWESDSEMFFIGDFDGDGTGDVFRKISDKRGEGLAGDNLEEIFNVSSSDYFKHLRLDVYSKRNEDIGIDITGENLKDMIFIVSPQTKDSRIYAVVGQPPAQMPDLTVSMQVPTMIKVNEQFQINMTVKNIGAAQSSATTLYLYIDNTLVETFNVNSLNPNETQKFTYQHTFTSEGLHIIRAVVDPNNNVDELNEGNNETSWEVNVYALKPDLVGQIDVPRYIKKMKNDTVFVEAEFMIENIGWGAVNEPFTLNITYLEYSATVELSESISPGDNVTFRIIAKVWPGGPSDAQVSFSGYNITIEKGGNISLGDKTVKVFIDSNDYIEELDETNNNVTVTSSVTRPDLIPILQIPEMELMPPASYELQVGAKNLGDVDADETLLVTKIEKGESIWYYNHTFNLSAGEEKTFNFSHDFSEPGLYTITVIANYNHETQEEPWDAELNYGNNTISYELPIILPSPVNITIPSFYDVPQGEIRNFSLTFESERVIKDFTLRFHYDPSVVMISATDLISNVTWDFMNNTLIGRDINRNGTFQVANITLSCVDDTGRESPINVSGEFFDVNGYRLPLNAINGSFSSLKITDLIPFLFSNNVFLKDENNSITVVVRNVKYVPSYNYSLVVYVTNATNGQKVTELFNSTMPGLPPWGGYYLVLEWKPEVAGGDYYLNATVQNDTIVSNNNFSKLITVKEYSLDAWKISYPYWNVMRGDTFWIDAYFSANAPGWVNATINVPDGLVVWNGTDWVRSDTKRIYAWPWDYNFVGWMAKGVKAGEYGNQTVKEINVTVEARGKSDTITTDESPPWKLVILTPTIWVEHFNATIINQSSVEELWFKTVNATTFDQLIRIAIQAGVDGRILTGLDYLVHYPYGCVEQTTSAMLGALHTDEYYRAKGAPPDYDFEKVNESVHGGIERLTIGGAVGQHDNGSWSMWGNYPPGHKFYTIYGSYGLGRVKQDDLFGGNVTIGDSSGEVNFSKTVEWLAGKLIDSENGSYWSTWSYYPGKVRITAFGMITHYQMLRYGELTDGAKEIANESMRKTTEFLISVQNESGGWGEIPYWGYVAEEPDAMTTALSVWALKLYGMESDNVTREEIENAIQKGMDWLIEHQDMLNGYWAPLYEEYYFDSYGLRSETTALALLALNESDSISGLNFTAYSTSADTVNGTMKLGVNFLLSTYRQMGSWGYTRATQTALNALTRLQPEFTSDVNVTIWVDGILIGSYRVNESNPREIITLNDTIISSVMSNTSMPAGGKRYWHVVTVNYTSGSGPVIVGVSNRQLVDRDEVVGEIVGHKIKSLSGGEVLRISKYLGVAQAESTSDVEIEITTPDVEGDGVVTVEITNNNDSVLLSPIIEVPLTGLQFNDSYPVNLTWANNSINPIPHEYDAANSTLKLFPDAVPERGTILVWFNATVNSGNNTFEVRVTPMYDETTTYIKSISKYIKGYGNIRVNVYNESGIGMDATVLLNSEVKQANTKVAVLEGSYTLSVTKDGYVPVSTTLSLQPGEDVNITVKLYSPDELTEPKVVMVVGDLSTLENSGSVVANTTVKPNAVTKAKTEFEMTLSGETKKLIAVKMPKLERGSLWAWLNDSVSIDANGQSVTPDELMVNGEKVLMLELQGSATVNMSFEGRMVGDIPGTPEGVDIADAMFIAQYDVGLRTFDNKALVYGDIPGTPEGVDIADAMFIAQYDVGLRNADYIWGG